MKLPKVTNDWTNLFKEFFKNPLGQNLISFIDTLDKENVYPKEEEIFIAFEKCSFQKTKVVILGQDPYHGPDQAHGLAFSVQDKTKIPPSLRNIFKELSDDLGNPIKNSGDLSNWATQGVLLLNTVLTVNKGEAGSHRSKGWEDFTSFIISKLSSQKENIVFILWGAPAQKKESLIDKNKHLILKAPHPSPLSSYRGFFKSKPFSKTNNYLSENKKTNINW